LAPSHSLSEQWRVATQLPEITAAKLSGICTRFPFVARPEQAEQTIAEQMYAFLWVDIPKKREI
jgi:hypothetical protein